ncbi:MAG: flagellar biosynthetic protein FliR [Paracoccaceae bacterium]|uniref:flagellar biosynthetic protein FliR n=1 Tax=Seohaeicola saemankumensis TaxID=481181 RepID=UPI001E5B0AA2|nr:flagellar biosynthetic protein FliR [Seohaeicola saemankumensis]
MDGAIFDIPALDLARLADPMAGFFVVMLRIGAFLIASPVFGGRFVPVPIRIVAAVCLTLAVSTQAELPGARDLAKLSAIPMILSEIAIGLTAGLVLTTLFAAAAMAGDKIANVAGLGFAMQVDPSAGGQSPVIAQLLGLAMMMVFLSTDSHLVALRIMFDSYQSYPPGNDLDLSALLTAGIGAGTIMFTLTSALMLPVVAGLLILNLAVGVISRSAPQLNLFSVGFPLALLALLVLMWLTAPQMIEGLVTIANSGLHALRDMFGRLGTEL